MVALKNVRVVRDCVTGASCCYAFVEFPTLKDSQELQEYLTRQSVALEVDGKALIVNYAKNTFSTSIATLEQQGMAQQQQQQEAGQQQQFGYYDYGSYYYQQQHPTAAIAADSKNAAEVAQAAILQSLGKKHKQVVGAAAVRPVATIAAPATAAITTVTIPTGANEYGQFPVPDVSTYQYDESSGYYYDSYTGLYYDANSTYYYNTQTQSYLYWDGERQMYMPAPSGTTTSSQDAAGQQPAAASTAEQPQHPAADANKRPPSPQKNVKIAKKIVKDMEKWAKKLNAQKDREPTAVVAQAQPIIDPAYVAPTASAAADAGFSLLEKTVAYNRRSNELARPKDLASATATTAIFADTDSPAAPAASSEPEPSSSSSGGAAGGALSVEELIDWDKLTCLLCRRAFGSKDILLKHQQMSELHKKNVDDLLKAKGGGLSQDGSTLQYRDRAKERREKYGQPEPPLPSKRRRPVEEVEPVPFEQPTIGGIKEDNIGNKLLQKMGWNAGQGLGRSQQGIVDPIEARHRQAQAGLGARGSSFNVDKNGTYKERARKTFYQYFQEIN